MSSRRLAVIGGSNLRVADFVVGAEPHDIRPGRAPVTVLETERAVIVARHGFTGHTPAHRVDHRANLEAVASLGCDRVLSVGSVGSLRSDWPVGTVCAPADFFAPSVTPSIYDDALGHSVPGFNVTWRDTIVATWHDRATTPIVDGGVYAQTTGPRFETPAEVRFLATVADVVGMTLAAECILAREVGLAYAAVCIVDNLANGLQAEPLSLQEFEDGVAHNRERLLADLSTVVEALGDG